MLKKETAEKVKKIAESVKPLLTKLNELGSKKNKIATQAREAREKATFFKYEAHNIKTPEGREQLHAEHIKYNALYNKMSETENALKVARFNLRKYREYIAIELLNALIPLYDELNERKGSETAQEIISGIIQHPFYIYIRSYYIEAIINISNYGYDEMRAIICFNHETKRPEKQENKEPELLTISQYKKAVKLAEDTERKIEELRKKAQTLIDETMGDKSALNVIVSSKIERNI